MTYVADPAFGNYSTGGLVCRHCGQLVGLDYGQRTPAGDGTCVHDSTRVAECEPVAVVRTFVLEESKNLRAALLALADQWEALAKESDADPQTARLAAAAEMSRHRAEEIQQIRRLASRSGYSASLGSCSGVTMADVGDPAVIYRRLGSRATLEVAIALLRAVRLRCSRILRPLWMTWAWRRRFGMRWRHLTADLLDQPNGTLHD
jgi:hypothetical protein